MRKMRAMRTKRRRRTISRRRRRRRVVGGSGAISGFVYGRADSHPSLERADRQTLSLRGVTIIPVIVVIIIIIITVIVIIIVIVINGVHIIHQCSHACHGWRDGREVQEEEPGTSHYLPTPPTSPRPSFLCVFFSEICNFSHFFSYIFMELNLFSLKCIPRNLHYLPTPPTSRRPSFFCHIILKHILFLLL